MQQKQVPVPLSFSFFFLVFEIGSHYIAGSGHELPILLLHLLSTRMAAVYNHTWLRSACFLQSWEEEPCKVPVEVDAYRPFHRRLLQLYHLCFWGAQMKEELRRIFSEESSTFKAAPLWIGKAQGQVLGGLWYVGRSPCHTPEMSRIRRVYKSSTLGSCAAMGCWSSVNQTL